MLIKQGGDLKSSDITPKALYLDRRRFLALGAAGAAAVMLGPDLAQAAKLAEVGKSALDLPLGPNDKPTPFKDVTGYNNFYELGADKEDPARNAQYLKPKPWSIAVEGECAKPGVIGFEDFVKPHRIEERIYRLRCVEAWSMVIPWDGIPLAAALARFEPTSKAKYVEFTTLYDPKQMPGQGRKVLDWPYTEGLRLDEAMNPLSLLATGLYGEELLPQNGAPLRLVVPWKYGFKSIKSIVKIRFTEQQPATAWNKSAPGEYGFYANVNPQVDHPRWSQAKERRIGDFFRRETLIFNGYADQVAGLYAGMDLKTFF